MEIQIRAKGLPGAAAIRRHALDRIGAALAEFRDLVEQVAVHLVDTNGPQRGGLDKLCRAVVRCRDSSVLVVEDLGGDVGGVVDRVARRLRDGLLAHRQARSRAWPATQPA